MDEHAGNDPTLAGPDSDDNGGEAAAEPKPLIWLLLGSRRGDNNQMVALAEALGMPFESKVLSYNRLRHVPPLRARMFHLTRRARASLRPPWPDLVIGLGSNSLPVARYVRKQSGGRARLVQIGDPRSSIRDLDLLITTPQFARRDAPNVLSLPFPIGDPARFVTVTSDEERWLDALPKPRRLVAVGGPTRKWKIDNQALGRAIEHLQGECARDGGSLIAVTSPRTPKSTMRLLEERLVGANDALARDFPRFAALLARCDQIYVTADSVSMLSEAILTGKPVGMIEIARTFRGWVGYCLRRLGLPYRADMAQFWSFLGANQLIGTVAWPIASEARDSTPLARDAVRRILRARPRRSGQR